MAESSIGLKTYFEFSGRAPAKHVDLGNADFFLTNTGITLPRLGPTFLYGFRGSQRVIGSAIQRARRRGMELCPVYAKAFVGTYTTQRQDAAGIASFRFLNVPTQIKASLKNDLRSRWEALLEQESLKDEFPVKPSPHMHLLDDLVQQPPYDRLSAIAYPVETEVGLAQLVTVFDVEEIHNVEANSIFPVNLSLVLPA